MGEYIEPESESPTPAADRLEGTSEKLAALTERVGLLSDRLDETAERVRQIAYLNSEDHDIDDLAERVTSLEEKGSGGSGSDRLDEIEARLDDGSVRTDDHDTLTEVAQAIRGIRDAIESAI